MNNSEKNPSKDAKDLILAHQHATLCTILHVESEAKGDGFPFGSVTPYDVQEDGRLIIAISTISQHYRNLRHNPRGSFFISERHGNVDPQAHARASVLGEFSEVQADELESIRSSYLTRFPKSAARTLAHDFLYFQCKPLRIRWIGGFGEITWVSADDYFSQAFDMVSYQSSAIIEHMNEDHQDAMAELVEFYCNRKCLPENCSLIAVNQNRLLIKTKNSEGEKDITLAFPSTVVDSNAVRAELIAMLKEARCA